MAFSPEIKTKRLLITPFSERHLTDTYVAWLNDPQVVRYSRNRYKQHSLDSCRCYWKSFDGTSHFFWAIEEIQNRYGHMGNMNAYIDDLNKVGDIGILIGEKNAWGKGYGAEAFEAICDFLFTEVNLRKVTAGTISENKQMLRVMDKIGMCNDGIRKKHNLWENKEVDIVHKAIFKENWLKKQRYQ